MRTALFIGLAFVPQLLAQVHDYPRDIFNTTQAVTGATPFPDYQPGQLRILYEKRHELELQLFDVINEAALRRDKSLEYYLKLYGSSLGYIPSLAVAHYKWVFGDKSQLDWLLEEDKKSGLGNDSLTVVVFGYMDEWDKTIARLKAHSKVADGAAGELIHQAIEIRKRLYGAQRFEKAWKAAKPK